MIELPQDVEQKRRLVRAVLLLEVGKYLDRRIASLLAESDVQPVSPTAANLGTTLQGKMGLVAVLTEYKRLDREEAREDNRSSYS